MPKISKDSVTMADHGPVQEWSGDVDGYTINFVAFKVDIDSAPMLKGLPGDRCTCPHWGYVLKGRVTFELDGRTEVFEPGDAFYVPAGHNQLADAGTEYVQFSPAEELAKVDEAIMRNMKAMQNA
jgi:glyoxylate utilization-related uncharacterized protein